ncbi:MAG TPA: TolC family protein [Limnochordales bacterium]
MIQQVSAGMRLLALTLAALLAAAGGAGVSAAGDEPSAIAVPTPAETPAPLYLSEALAQARACGPGFASASLAAEALELERLARRAQRVPAPRLSVQTDLHPVVRTGVTAAVEWTIFDRVTVSAQLPGSVTVGYTLWPPENVGLKQAVDDLSLAVRRLEYLHAVATAHRAVVEAFAGLEGARAGLTLAAQELALARERAAAAHERYVSGQIGFRQWQEARQALRDAEVAYQQAQSGVQQAEKRLARLMWSACDPDADGSVLADRSLIDDLPWDEYIAQVQAVLAQPEAESRERALARHLGYQEALLEQRRRELALAEAKRAARLNLAAGASVKIPVAGGPGAQPDFTAQVTAQLDLSQRTRVQEQQEALALAAAEARAQQALLEALDAVSAARLALENAQLARDVAERGARQSLDDLAVVERRRETGFAGPLELAEAELAVAQAAVKLAQAETDVRLAWLALGTLLGVQPPERQAEATPADEAPAGH